MFDALNVWMNTVDCWLIGIVGKTSENYDFNWFLCFIDGYEAKEAVHECLTESGELEC